MTYQPAQDTYLLLKSMQKILQQELFKNPKKILRVCEVGCGSGEIITELKKEYKDFIEAYATDCNPQAIEDTKKCANQKKVSITIQHGNFCEPFEHMKFDIIFFNTPYLPCEDNEIFSELSYEDRAIYGGKVGCEVTNDFIDSLHSIINITTKVYILISSLTQPHLVEENIRENGFEYLVISKEKHFFEELVVYELQLSQPLHYLLEQNYTHISKFNKGKHSYILQAKKDSSNVMIKTGKEQHILKEIFYLEKLQHTSYVPKIVDKGKNFVIYTKIEGIAIHDFLKQIKTNNYTAQEVETVLNRILEICFDLDCKGISKDEMTRPHHHIFINIHNLEHIYFIDFERSTLTHRFENSRQFMQYLIKCNTVFKHIGLEFSQEKSILIGKKIGNNPKTITVQDLLV